MINAHKRYLNLRNVYRKTGEPTNLKLGDHGMVVHYWSETEYIMNGDINQKVDIKYTSPEKPTVLRAGELETYFGFEKQEARELNHNHILALMGRTIEYTDRMKYLKQLKTPILVAKKEKTYAYVILQRYDFEGNKILKVLSIYRNKDKAKNEVERLKLADSRYEYIVDSIEFHS